MWVGLALLLALFLIPQLLGGSGGKELTYSEFQRQVENKQVREVTINTESHIITGTTVNGDEFKVSGPTELNDTDT